MTLGCWLSNYPPLSARIEAIQPALGSQLPYSTRGPMRATLILGSFIVVPWVIGMAAFSLWMATLSSLSSLGENTHEVEPAYVRPALPVEQLDMQVHRDLAMIADVLRAHHAAQGDVIDDEDALSEIWPRYRAAQALPTDPFDGYGYGMYRTESGVRLFSSGPDGASSTEDDIALDVPF
jgi:hypothetical protein